MTAYTFFEDIPRGKYSVIDADCPWRYSNTGVEGAAENHYNTMSIEQLCTMPVKDIAAQDAFLFLWVTFPILYEAEPVFKAWGFEYKTLGFSWIKKYPGGGYCLNTGFYIRGNCEVCLLGTRGKARDLIQDKGISSVIVEDRQEHSQKPLEAKKRIEQFVGNVPKIELFARNLRQGWDIFGNAVEEEKEEGLLTNWK